MMVRASSAVPPRSFGANVRKSSCTRPRDMSALFSLGPPSTRTLLVSRSRLNCLSADVVSGYPSGVSGTPITSATSFRFSSSARAFAFVVITMTCWPRCGIRFSRTGTLPSAVRMTAMGCGMEVPLITPTSLSSPSESLSARRVPAPIITASTRDLTLRIVALSTLLPMPALPPPVDVRPSTEVTIFAITYGKFESRQAAGSIMWREEWISSWSTSVVGGG